MDMTEMVGVVQISITDKEKINQLHFHTYAWY